MEWLWHPDEPMPANLTELWLEINDTKFIILGLFNAFPIDPGIYAIIHEA